MGEIYYNLYLNPTYKMKRIYKFKKLFLILESKQGMHFFMINISYNWGYMYFQYN